MYRENEDTIELGAVSADTRGKLMGFADVEEGQQVTPSLSDD
jgi:hypothetical protein